MALTKKIAIALLIFAISFSIISINMNLTIGDFKKIKILAPQAQAVSGASGVNDPSGAGGVSLLVKSNGGNADG